MKNIQLKFHNISMDIDNYFALLLHSDYITHYVSNIFSWLQIDIIIKSLYNKCLLCLGGTSISGFIIP